MGGGGAEGVVGHGGRVRLRDRAEGVKVLLRLLLLSCRGRAHGGAEEIVHEERRVVGLGLGCGAGGDWRRGGHGGPEGVIHHGDAEGPRGASAGGRGPDVRGGHAHVRRRRVRRRGQGSRGRGRGGREGVGGLRPGGVGGVGLRGVGGVKGDGKGGGLDDAEGVALMGGDDDLLGLALLHGGGRGPHVEVREEVHLGGRGSLGNSGRQHLDVGKLSRGRLALGEDLRLGECGGGGGFAGGPRGLHEARDVLLCRLEHLGRDLMEVREVGSAGQVRLRLDLPLVGCGAAMEIRGASQELKGRRGLRGARDLPDALREAQRGLVGGLKGVAGLLGDQGRRPQADVVLPGLAVRDAVADGVHHALEAPEGLDELRDRLLRELCRD